MSQRWIWDPTYVKSALLYVNHLLVFNMNCVIILTGHILSVFPAQKYLNIPNVNLFHFTEENAGQPITIYKSMTLKDFTILPDKP